MCTIQAGNAIAVLPSQARHNVENRPRMPQGAGPPQIEATRHHLKRFLATLRPDNLPSTHGVAIDERGRLRVPCTRSLSRDSLADSF